MNYKYEKVNISSIQLDRENPRFPPVDTERDAIMAMLDEQGDKLLILATDIVHYGLDPSKRLIVFKEKGQHIDGDGNRRMTALKILETPDLIKKHKLYLKFKKLSQKQIVKIDLVECVVFKSREAIKHWIEINHGGELEGRGQVQWNPEQKERFNGTKSTGLMAKEALLNAKLISDDEFNLVNLTTLSRLLDSRPGQKALSIEKKKGNVQFNDMSALQTIYSDLKGIHVKKVYHDSDRKDFLIRSLGTLEPSSSIKKRKGINEGTPSNKTSPRRTQRVKKGNRLIFGEALLLKPGLVNNVYRDICEIYEMSKASGHCVEILGFSMRLILDVAAHEYFEKNPKEGQSKDAVYKDYLKLIKSGATKKNKNTLAVDRAIKTLIEEEKVEALLGKLAHNSIQVSIDMILNLSFIIGPILKIHFSKGER